MKLQKFSDYLEFGFSVMPCRGKNPLLSWKKYQKEKPLKESVLEWDKTNHNIAIITGKVSNLVIVDIDGEYPKDLPKMPKTWAVKTAKGYHYYFEYPDFEIGNRTNIFNAKEGETKIDIRGEGGYVIAPPSKHETGVHYEWVNSPDTCFV
jgi:TPP-dependent trihydroxycyclohexane-1,2-dione (THcHDO) dehydratase